MSIICQDFLKKMEQIINNPGFYYIAENIFQKLDLKDLSNCQLVSRSFNGFVEKPFFWLKKLIRRGLSKKNQKDWIDAFDETKDTELIKIVLLYFKKILKKQDFIDIPCFIAKRRRSIRSLRALQGNQKSLEKFYHQALECKDMGSLQILAPLMKNPNAPFPSGSMARSSRFMKRYAGFTPIQVAAGQIQPQILKVLAPLCDNLNDPYPGGEGFTPISWAAFNGHAEVVEVLAPLVANPNKPMCREANEMHTGATISPCGMASMNGHLNVLKVLVPFVNDLNASQFILKSGKGMSALGIAAHAGHLEVIRFLAQLVDPIAATDEMEDAPIFSAIYNRQPEAVKLLAYLSKNLPTPLTTKGGFSPIQIAEAIGADEIVDLIFVFEIF